MNIHSNTMQQEEKRLRPEWLLLPQELVMELLSRLSVKSLGQCKLVCKSLNSLISDTHFLKLHLSRCSGPNANPLVLFCVPYGVKGDISSLRDKYLLKTSPSTELQVLCSNWKEPHLTIDCCNGLVCLIGTRDSHEFWVIFWNPATRSTSKKWFPIVPPEYEDSYLNVYCGFGYDHVSDTYKVVVLQRNQHVIVFNMGDSSWRHVGCFPSDLTHLEDVNIFGVHFSGTLNWLVILKIHENYFDYENDEYTISWDNSSCMIISFDLNKEKFVRLLLPGMPHKFYYPQLEVLGECLCVSHCDNRQDNFVIWQMKEFGVDGSWTKLLNINYHKELKPPRLLPTPFVFPLYMFDNGDVLVLSESFCYNHIDNRLDTLEEHIYGIYPSCAMICCKSLISPC